MFLRSGLVKGLGFLLILSVLIAAGHGRQQARAQDRTPAVANQFYPGSEAELRSMVKELFAQAVPSKDIKNVVALISPHAGYVFSGGIAASAYNQIDLTRRYDNILPMTPVSILEKAREIAVKTGIRYAYVGNVPGHWAEHTYCHKCGKMIVERRGFRILSNHLEHGKCKFCSETIPGIWSS